MSRDIEVAMALAVHAPSGEAAVLVRERLRGITLLAGPAQDHVRRMTPSRERDVAAATVRHARSLTGSGGDAAATLGLLAKSVQHLMRYAAQALPAQPVPAASAGQEQPSRLVLVPPLPSSKEEGIAHAPHPYGRGHPARAAHKEDMVERSKSEQALESTGPAVVAPDGAASIVAPSSVVRIEDVEDEGP